METERFSPDQQDAFLGLLDDQSAPVRHALIAHFNRLGEPARVFLQRVATGPNRILRRHAAWFLNELKFADPVAEFRGFIRSMNYELETGALLLARTVNPGLDAGACCANLDRIAARARELIIEPATPREKCRVLNRVLFSDWGFRGNAEHYNDPRNSLLDQVLLHRKGIPISLSIVYLLVAGRAGLELEPVGLPGHFVIGCFTERPVFYVDPFEQGALRDASGIVALLHARNIEPHAGDLAPTPVREVLCRSCRNLARHWHDAGDEARAGLFASFVEEFETTYERHAM